MDDQVLFKLRDDTADLARARVLQDLAELAAVKRVLPAVDILPDLFVVELRDAQKAQEVIAALNRDQAVEFAELAPVRKLIR